MRRTRADKAGRELVEIGLADGDRARRDESRDDGGTFLRHIGIGRAASAGRQASDIDIVLHREGQAEKRQPRLVLARQGIERTGAGDNILVGKTRDPDGGVATGRDAPQRLGRDVFGAHAAGARRAQRIEREGQDIHDATSSFGCDASPSGTSVTSAWPA